MRYIIIDGIKRNEAEMHKSYETFCYDSETLQYKCNEYNIEFIKTYTI